MLRMRSTLGTYIPAGHDPINGKEYNVALLTTCVLLNNSVFLIWWRHWIHIHVMKYAMKNAANWPEWPFDLGKNFVHLSPMELFVLVEGCSDLICLWTFKHSSFVSETSTRYRTNNQRCGARCWRPPCFPIRS